MNPKTRKLLEQILMFAKRTQKRTNNVSLETFLDDKQTKEHTRTVSIAQPECSSTAQHTPVESCFTDLFPQPRG